MFKRYKAGFVMGAIFMAMIGMQAQAAPLGDGLGEGIASNFDQTTARSRPRPPRRWYGSVRRWRAM